MKLRSLSLTLLALCVLAAPAQSADTVLLSDDMEGAIDAKWTVGEPTNPLMEPWQKSDSTAPKVRGNQANGGSASYWAGPTVQGMHPADIVEGESHLVAKAPIIIPADGKTTVSFFSLFQNEGDDAGQFEAALASNPNAKGAWKKIAAVKLEPSDITQPEYTPGYCTPNPGTHLAGFEEVKGDFAAFAGREVLVRFNYKLGGENRQTSFPCGWYVDDLKITTSGTPGKLAGPDAAPAPGPGGTAPAKSKVKLSGFKAKGKRATLKLNVANGPVSKAVVTLLKGKKRMATASFAELGSGATPVTFKLKKKLKRGTYVLRFTGTGADGSPVKASGKGKAR